MSNKIFIGGAWPYVNGDIHIGHLVGYFIPCDILARYSRIAGYDTLLVSGADCHGTPITVEADKRKIAPRELIEMYIPKVHEVINTYGISYDLFTTTITENHKKVTQEVFLNLLKNGYISKEISQQYYSEVDAKFLPDRYVEGECPFCHSQNQRADQCEVCGRTIGLGELIEPRSKLTNSQVILKDTEHYFLQLPKLEPLIKEFVNKNEGKWRDWVWKETTGFLNEGLHKRAITRDLDWGIDIPNNEIPKEMRIEGIESKRFYVWFDAVIGYLSASIEYCNSKSKDYKDFWNNSKAKHYYFMGQDNLTFHTIFWPGLLIGQKKEYNLPNVPSISKFLNANGAKLSKSRGNIIDAKSAGEFFGSDAIRFYLTSTLPENKEGNWDWRDFKNSNNGILVGEIGNFIHRVLTFYQNKIDSNIQIENQKLDSKVLEKINSTFKEISRNIETTHFVDSILALRQLAIFANQYFDFNKPWVLVKEDKLKAEKVIFNCINIVLALRTLLAPFVPNATTKLNQNLGLEESLKVIDTNHFQFNQDDFAKMKLVKDVQPIFRKIEDEEIDKFKEIK